jgi:hypothetical protein
MTDLALYSLDPKTGLVTFSFAASSRAVSGPSEALQIVAYHLFTTRGSNAYNKDEGGGMQSLTKGRVLSQGELKTEAALQVARAMSNIRISQSPDKPEDSKIIGLRLVDAEVRGDAMHLSIRIELASGNSFTATFRT